MSCPSETWLDRPCPPGSKINTTKDDYAVIRNMQMMRFDSKQWKLFGYLL
jgi:hypothetical protein